MKYDADHMSEIKLFTHALSNIYHTDSNTAVCVCVCVSGCWVVSLGTLAPTSHYTWVVIWSYQIPNAAS